jgi:hypothetical protein
MKFSLSVQQSFSERNPQKLLGETMSTPESPPNFSVDSPGKAIPGCIFRFLRLLYFVHTLLNLVLFSFHRCDSAVSKTDNPRIWFPASPKLWTIRLIFPFSTVIFPYKTPLAPSLDALPALSFTPVRRDLKN